jgi:hypothetical protein
MVRSRSCLRSLLVGLALGVVGLGVSLSVAQTEGQRALTNDDVVQLSKLGLGDAVIIAKIEQSAAIDFRLDIPDLERLKAEGVGNDVIAAMLRKATVPAAPPPAAAPAPARPLEGSVFLVGADGGQTALDMVPGTVSSTYAFVTVLIYSNFEGLKATVRTTDRQPILRLYTARPPKGRYFLVTAKPDEGDGVRSVKLGNMGWWANKRLNAPDVDNLVECEIVEKETGVWEYKPKKELKPGEYGLWLLGDPGEMAGFGID